MTEHYVIDRQGGQWIASNGETHVESDDPCEALDLLCSGELDAEYCDQPVEDGVLGLDLKTTEEAGD